MPLKLNSTGGGSVTLTPPSTASDLTLTLPSSNGTAIFTPLQAGNTTVAPLTLTSGTNLTTAVAGSIEYDGKVMYFTTQGTQRGAVPGMQYYRLLTSVVGANTTGTQSIFGVGVTLSSTTVYAFESAMVFTRSAGTTSHTLSTLFGGTATLNNINYLVYEGDQNVSFNSRVTVSQGVTAVNTAAATVVTGAMAAATQIAILNIKGTVSINSGGTFIPQYSLSAAPGGAYTTATGSYFAIWPIGTAGSNISVGAWA